MLIATFQHFGWQKLQQFKIWFPKENAEQHVLKNLRIYRVICRFPMRNWMRWKKRQVHIFLIVKRWTPRKINMEQNNEGLVQIIFLSKWMICRFYVNLPGWSSSFRSFFCFFSYTSGKLTWLAGFFLPCESNVSPIKNVNFPISY